MHSVSYDAAKLELKKFLQLAETSGFIPMFSKYIDKTWHDMSVDHLIYKDFCDNLGVTAFEHLPLNGSGNIEWVPAYEQRFGKLTAEWFTDENGVVDGEAYQLYEQSGKVWACWDCGPSTRQPYNLPTDTKRKAPTPSSPPLKEVPKNVPVAPSEPPSTS